MNRSHKKRIEKLEEKTPSEDKYSGRDMEDFYKIINDPNHKSRFYPDEITK